MLIEASNLYRDMLNFFYNQFNNIFLLTLITALIGTMLGHIFLPISEHLITLRTSISTHDTINTNLAQLLKQMPLEEQLSLLKDSAIGSITSLFNNALLTGGLLTLIRQTSNLKSFNILRSIVLFAPILPRLTLLIFLNTLLVELGLLLIVIPGILIAIALSLAPIISISNNLGVIQSMRLSANLAFMNFGLLAPAVLFWLIAKIVILLIVTKFIVISSLLALLLFNCLNNLISALLLIYLYRLYMLLQKA